MKTHRPAYALNELLILMFTFTIFLGFSAKMGWTLLREIPMTIRYFNTQASTQSMLESLRQDVETARDLQLTEEEGDDAVGTLTIDGPQGHALYTFASGQMQRIPPDPDPNAPGFSCWTLPDVRIAWQVQRENGRAAVLEISTWQQRTFMGKERINFKQAHLFFTGLQKGNLREE